MQKPRSSYAKSLALIAVFTAILVVCSWISVPFGAVPISLQTFAVFAAFCILGGWRGAIAVCCYLAMGAIGLPVFAGFSAGLGHLAGPTGGFLVGMAVAGVAYALVCGKSKKPWRMVIGCAIALLVIYTVGTVWYAVVLGQGEASISSALLTCVAPFAFPDVLKLILAVLVATRIHNTARV